MKFFIFLLCAALFVFLVVRGAVLLIKDLFNGEFSYEGSGYKPPNDERRLKDIDVGGVPGVPGIPSGGFGPSDELRGGTKGWFANNCGRSIKSVTYE